MTLTVDAHLTTAGEAKAFVPPLEHFAGNKKLTTLFSTWTKRPISQDSNVLITGDPGTGKTSLAQLIASHTSKVFEQLSAVSASVRDVRDVLDRAGARLGEQSRGTILFLDEVHRFTKNQQDALLPGVESGLIVLIGATTENPFFELNAPLLSRSTLFRLEPLGPSAIRTLVERGLSFEGIEAESDAIDLLVSRGGGDGRHALTSLEVSIALARHRSTSDGPPVAPVVTVGDVEAALGTTALRYGADEHYDVTSAFIKSIRGSDPDAALHYLARMLEAGEDARFIARRLVIAASEDVGLADQSALLVADAAARAVEFVGLPEAQLHLAHATVARAVAPKSNSVTTAIAAASDPKMTRNIIASTLATPRARVRVRRRDVCVERSFIRCSSASSTNSETLHSLTRR